MFWTIIPAAIFRLYPEVQVRLGPQWQPGTGWTLTFSRSILPK
jgi:hypothetical protein